MKLTKFKKAAALAVATMAMMTFVAGCGSDKGGDSKEIKLGADIEMTGGNASFGTSTADGIKMAIKEVNAAGGIDGKKVSLVLVDNRSDIAEATNGMQKLADEKVAAVVAPNTSSGAIATASVVDSEKLVAITPGGSNPKVTVDPNGNKVRKYFFRATFIDPFQGQVMANFASKTLNAKKAAIFVDSSSDYSKGLAENFKQSFEKLGGTVVVQEGYLQKDTDFKAALTKIKSENPDIIFIPGYYQEVGLIIKQAREMGINVPLLGADGWDSSKLPELAVNENLHDTYFSNHYSVDSDDPSTKKFVAAFEKEYGHKPDSFAALGYDSAMLLMNAIKTAGSTDPDKVQAAMAATKDYEGATGKMSIDQNHDAIKAAVILSYTPEGTQKFVEKIAP